MPVHPVGFNWHVLVARNPRGVLRSGHADDTSVGAWLLPSSRAPVFQSGLSFERFGKVKALPTRTTKGRQRRCELYCFNALGGGGHAEGVGEAKYRPNDRDAVRIDHHSRHEAAIDLEHVDWKSLEIRQAGIACSEI